MGSMTLDEMHRLIREIASTRTAVWDNDESKWKLDFRKANEYVDYEWKIDNRRQYTFLDDLTADLPGRVTEHGAVRKKRNQDMEISAGDTEAMDNFLMEFQVNEKE